MTLLNSVLAFGALAFTIPLAIHLLFRSRFRTVDWGAMHLLANVVRVNRRRIELMNLLLLLLRCLLPVLLAFCLARPVLTGFQSLPGDAPQSLIIALDESRSLAVRDTDGVVRMDRVKREVTELLRDLSRRDEVILVRSGGVDPTAGSMGPQMAIDRLSRVRADGGPFDLARLLRSAVKASDASTYPNRRILVISDFQSHMLDDQAFKSLQSLQASLDQNPLAPVIDFLNVGIDTQSLDNVFVEFVQSESPAVVVGHTASFSAQIRNATDMPIRELPTRWSINGVDRSPKMITIAPRSTVTLQMTHKFEKVGIQSLSLSIQHGDALPDDNRRMIGVDVIRPINVLLVDGDPGKGPLGGETDFLAIALSPFAFGGQDQPDAVRTRVTRMPNLIRDVAQTTPAVVVLANVDEVPSRQRARLADFVADGGSLVIFDGDQVRPASYNQLWQSETHAWRLPAKLGSIVGNANAQGFLPNARAAIDATIEIGSQYAAWQMLDGNPSSGANASSRPLADVTISAYRELEIHVSGSDVENTDIPNPAVVDVDPAAMQILSLSTGQTLAVGSRRGRGQVVQFAFPGDADWSTLPLRMAYLPMMQQMVLDLAGSRRQTTIDVGQSIRIPVSELTDALSRDAQIDSKQPVTYTAESVRDGIGENRLRILSPSGGSPPTLFIGDASSPGIYRAIASATDQDGNVITAQTMRVAEVPAIESQLRDADDSRLTQAAQIVGAEVYADIHQFRQDDLTRRFGRETWRWLLVAMLVAMVGELFLQQRIVRGRSVWDGARIRGNARTTAGELT